MHHPRDRIIHTTAFVKPVVEHWQEREIVQWVHPMNDRSDDPSHHERTLLPRSYISLLVYKKKGDQLDPRNYRPITLLSCLGKIFTSIINSRLTVFSDEVELLDTNQSGFRQGYSTIDNMFVLHILLELLKGTKTNMYCAFVDFEKSI